MNIVLNLLIIIIPIILLIFLFKAKQSGRDFKIRFEYADIKTRRGKVQRIAALLVSVSLIGFVISLNYLNYGGQGSYRWVLMSMIFILIGALAIFTSNNLKDR